MCVCFIIVNFYISLHICCVSFTIVYYFSLYLYGLLAVHQGLVLCPSCVLEKVGINQGGVDRN